MVGSCFKKNTLHVQGCSVLLLLLNFPRSQQTRRMNMSKSKSTPMTPAAASRIQSTQSKASGGQTPKGSFAARAQSSAAKNGK